MSFSFAYLILCQYAPAALATVLWLLFVLTKEQKATKEQRQHIGEE